MSMGNHVTKLQWMKDYTNSHIIRENSRKNKLELLEYLSQKYNISESDFEDDEKFQSILRELKIEELINN